MDEWRTTSNSGESVWRSVTCTDRIFNNLFAAAVGEENNSSRRTVEIPRRSRDEVGMYKTSFSFIFWVVFISSIFNAAPL